MKLKAIWIWETEIQDYLDKYQEKVKFIFRTNYECSEKPYIIVIDEA